MNEILTPTGHRYPLYRTKFQDLYSPYPEREFCLLVAAATPVQAAEQAVKYFWNQGDLADTEEETYTVRVTLYHDDLSPVEVEVQLNFTVKGTVVS